MAEMRLRAIRCDDARWQRATRKAARQHRGLSEVIRTLLDEYADDDSDHELTRIIAQLNMIHQHLHWERLPGSNASSVDQLGRVIDELEAIRQQIVWENAG